MVGSIIKLATTRTFWYVVVAVVLLGSLWAFGNHQYNRGFSDRDAEYQQALQEERERLEAANEEALKDAENRIKELEMITEQRDELLQEIIRNSSTRSGNGVSVDSLRELNRID
jgi:uncharacterized protein HemX